MRSNHNLGKKMRGLTITAMLLLLVTLTCVILAGCDSDKGVNTDDMHLVIYNGNGGYLGDKTTTVRRLYCYDNSLIPDYPTEYTDQKNTISSLGLAVKNGYALRGWYASDDTSYQADPNGLYILLSTEDGNGIYELAENGAYIYAFNADAAGAYLNVSIQNSSDENATFIYINAPVMNGSEVKLATGFYVCSGSDDINAQDDPEIRAAYEAAYNAKRYSATEAKTLSGVKLYEDLSESDKAFYENETRYNRAFREATADDSDVERYDLVTDYANIEMMMVEDAEGAYCKVGNEFLKYDSTVDALAGAKRYSVSPFYKFTSTDAKPTPTSYDRFNMTVKYWDFMKDRVTADKLNEDGILELKAHWVKKNTVYYHYNNGTSQVDESTTKLLADNITAVPLVGGELIGRKEIIPGYAGHTFLAWSKSETVYEPWNFNTDVFPNGEAELHLYAHYIEGEYTRITSADGLAKVGQNPNGKYLLVNDIDLKGVTYTGSSPLGLTGKVFTGEFRALDKTIRNFTLKVAPTKKNAETANSVAALFPTVKGATIDGLTVECNVSYATGAVAIGVNRSSLSAAALVAVDESEAGQAAVINNCHTRVTISTSGNYNVNVMGGGKVHFTLSFGEITLADSVVVTGCTATTNTEVLDALSTNENVTVEIKKLSGAL